MTFSRNIQEYFEVDFTTLKAGVSLPFDVYLYFKTNQHVLLWIKKEDQPTSDFLARYLSRGCEKVWIHQSQKELYELYLHPPVESPSTQETPLSPTVSQPSLDDSDFQRTPEGALVESALDSPDLTQEEKKAIVEEIATQALAEIPKATNPEEEDKVRENLEKIVHDVVDNGMKKKDPLLQEVWRLANDHPDIEHSTHVATFAVLFAMAFGRIDRDLLADIALAATLHDIGLSRVDFSTVHTPWKDFDGPLLSDYASHVTSAVELLKRHENIIPPRVHQIVTQHHEKFNGSGYPKKLEGFDFDDVAQLVAISDFVDSIASGHFDGEPRSIKESFEIIEKIEKSKSFPEYFNPDILSHVINWVNGKTEDHTDKETASRTVAEQIQNIMG